MLKKFGKKEILKYLHLIDDRITMPFRIELCGTAAILLQDCNFRETFDIDFTRVPDVVISATILKIFKELPELNTSVFDERAPGIVCLLEDYEDRLIEIKDDFKYLKVYVISVVDWMVSKLEAPKFGDLLEYKHFVTRERLDFIENNMYLYCGLRDDIAKHSLKILRNQLTE